MLTYNVFSLWKKNLSYNIIKKFMLHKSWISLCYFRYYSYQSSTYLKSTILEAVVWKPSNEIKNVQKTLLKDDEVNLKIESKKIKKVKRYTMWKK